MKARDAASAGSRSKTARAGPATEKHVPKWQRLARRILPSAIRRPLNRLNLARIRWQQEIRKSRAPSQKTASAHAESHADPNGPWFCPVCETRLDQFLPGGHYGRPNAKCPVCGSLERHRAAWLYLRNHATWLDAAHGTVRLLHVAPEPPMQRCLQALPHIDYLSADIEPGRAMVTMDLTDIDMPEEQFDVIFCSHVLEHIPDDLAAMREMRRVLKSGGTAYIQVPLRPGNTQENPSITSPEGRKEAFGQEDHVRIYGTDIVDRLQNAGFQASLHYASATLSDAQRKQMNTGNRCLVVCHKRT